MIFENAVFWQMLVFLLWGYLSASVLHALFGFPRRLIEAQ